jgi:hypothetical protein
MQTPDPTCLRALPTRLAAATALVLAFLLPGRAHATQRHFAYTYESGVLNPGDAELEPWTTFRHGRSGYYSAFDQRLEFEMGLAKTLQTSLYWNFSSVTEDTAGVRSTGFEGQGVSSEWKYKLSDPMADAVGSAVYLEGTAGTNSAEVEAKLILDKRAGPWLVALNLVGDHEWKWTGHGKTIREAGFELDLGAGYQVTDAFFAGIEARGVGEFEDADELESATVFAGPTLGVARDSWWFSLSFTPQLGALKGATRGSHLDLDHQERVQARVVMGFHL